ncbi:hypothetical protein N7535_007493 [Penicillium sp. DV-2018c]|nr:hypothetical protein N7461_003519 [Penicillium sp. DV-2018c]KAJ5565855.1 hypothetical protein N7535_007493 [Penicillium sp. DV-2018c]
MWTISTKHLKRTGHRAIVTALDILMRTEPKGFNAVQEIVMPVRDRYKDVDDIDTGVPAYIPLSITIERLGTEVPAMKDFLDVKEPRQ